MKKICFVAHEFGHFKGHGGIASYLYQICSIILEKYEDFYVTVIALALDPECDLLKNPRFSLKALPKGDLSFEGRQVLEILKVEKPDFVECAEYLGLCLESIFYKRFIGKELKDTVFVTNNHTASKECYEWSTKLPIIFAPPPIKFSYMREKLQLQICDLAVAPSNFLANYVMKNYNLQDVKVIPHPVKVQTIPKEQNIASIMNEIDLSQYKGKFVISCLTRIEGRKNQSGLIKAFVSFLRKTHADAVLLLIGNSSVDEITGQDVRERIFDEIPDDLITKIQFFDFVGEKGKRLFFSISDLTVLASPFENFPVAMTESIVMEVPILISKYCGCSDFMHGIEVSSTFDPFSKSDLEEKIEQFYKFSDEERKKLCKTQFENLQNLVSPENSVAGKIEQYKSISFKQPTSLEEKLFFTLSDLFSNNFDFSKRLNLIIGDEFFEKDDVQNFIEKLNKLPNFPMNSIICAGNENFDFTVIDSFCNRKLLIFFDIGISGNQFDKITSAVIEKVLNTDNKNFYSLPIPLKKKKSDKTNFFYKKIIDSVFIEKNQLQLEDLL